MFPARPAPQLPGRTTSIGSFWSTVTPKNSPPWVRVSPGGSLYPSHLPLQLTSSATSTPAPIGTICAPGRRVQSSRRNRKFPEGRAKPGLLWKAAGRRLPGALEDDRTGRVQPQKAGGGGCKRLLASVAARAFLRLGGGGRAAATQGVGCGVHRPTGSCWNSVHGRGRRAAARRRRR